MRRDVARLADGFDESSPVGRMVRSMLLEVAAGHRVVVMRPEDEVTPAEAARIIGVTRQYVDRLCEDEILAFRRLPGSRHRRIRLADVTDVVQERDDVRRGADAIRSALDA